MKRGGGKDLKAAINLTEIKDDITGELKRRDLKARAASDKQWFTPRELKVLARIAEFFRDLKADDMSEFSHKSKKPWASVYQNGKGQGLLIPPELVFDAEPLMHEVPSIEPEELKYRKEGEYLKRQASQSQPQAGHLSLLSYRRTTPRPPPPSHP